VRRDLSPAQLTSLPAGPRASSRTVRIGTGGIEPPTSSVSRKRSPTELRAYGCQKGNRIGYQWAYGVSTAMNREILVRAFFFAALLFLLAQVYDVLSSFLKPIAWS